MIYRVRKTSETYYTPTLNAPANNSELSWAARGMLWYLLTQADSWNATTGDLIRKSPAGEHATRSALKELVEFGYLVQRVERTADNTRNKRFFYDVYEEPQIQDSLSCENLQIENLHIENHQLIINKSQQKIKEEREIFEYPSDLLGLKFYEQQIGESIEPFVDALRYEIKRLGELRVIAKAKACTNGESWQYLLKSLRKLSPEATKQKSNQGDEWHPSGYGQKDDPSEYAMTGGCEASDEAPYQLEYFGDDYGETVDLNATIQLPGNFSADDQYYFDMGMQQLELQFDRATFDTWIKPAKLTAICHESNTMTFEVPNQYAQRMLQNRLYRNLRRVFSDTWNKNMELVFTLGSRDSRLPIYTGLKTGHVSACPA